MCIRDRPYGVQIFGEVPEIMGEATAAIEQYEFDFVDINMGCPAPKIVSGGAGSKLMPVSYTHLIALHWTPVPAVSKTA